MSRLRSLQELSSSRPSSGSASSPISPIRGMGSSNLASPDNRNFSRSPLVGSPRAEGRGAEAVKKAREENFEAEIAAKEEALNLKKERTVELRLKHFRKKFDQFDASGDGSIDREETHQAFKELGIQIDKYKVNKMFDKHDKDGSGNIDFNEFYDMIVIFNRERYTKVFESFDVDGSGELDAEEVGKAFEQLGFEFTAEYTRDLIKEFDYSEDGLIQLEEFIDMIESTLIVQEDKIEEVKITESPWGRMWEMEADFEGECDEATATWAWRITSTMRADRDEQDDEDRTKQLPFGWRPTAYLKADGCAFRGTDHCVIVNRGWRQRGVPCRQVEWNYNEERSWDVEFKDPKTGVKTEVMTGNGIPQLGEVKFRAATLLGDARRTIRIPFASREPLTLGDVVGELLDLASEGADRDTLLSHTDG